MDTLDKWAKLMKLVATTDPGYRSMSDFCRAKWAMAKHRIERLLYKWRARRVERLLAKMNRHDGLKGE